MNNHRLTNVTAIMTIFVVLLLSLFCISSSAYADDNVVEHKEVSTYNGMSEAIVKNLILAYQIGKEVLGNPETLQAIMMQESKGVGGLVGNKSAPPSKRSYGLMQVQIPTARSVLRGAGEVMTRYFPDRSLKSVKDGEIEHLLLKNDEANIRIAAYHYKMDIAFNHGNWDKSVASYNVGIGGIKRIKNPAGFPYVNGVRSYLKRVIRPFNEHFKPLLTQYD